METVDKVDKIILIGTYKKDLPKTGDTSLVSIGAGCWSNRFSRWINQT